jgi:hypothetical protein
LCDFADVFVTLHYPLYPRNGELCLDLCRAADCASRSAAVAVLDIFVLDLRLQLLPRTRPHWVVLELKLRNVVCAVAFPLHSSAKRVVLLEAGGILILRLLL